MCLSFTSNFHIHLLKGGRNTSETVIVKVAVMSMAALKALDTYKHGNVQGNLKHQATHKLMAPVSEL